MSKGNTYRQLKKKRQRNKKYNVKRQDVLFQCIDGNMTYYPIAFCAVHNGYLTIGLISTHHCRRKHCKYIREITFDKKGKVKDDFFKNPQQ